MTVRTSTSPPLYPTARHIRTKHEYECSHATFSRMPRAFKARRLQRLGDSQVQQRGKEAAAPCAARPAHLVAASATAHTPIAEGPTPPTTTATPQASAHTCRLFRTKRRRSATRWPRERPSLSAATKGSRSAAALQKAEVRATPRPSDGERGARQRRQQGKRMPFNPARTRVSSCAREPTPTFLAAAARWRVT